MKAVKIAELVKLAKEMRDQIHRHERFGLQLLKNLCRRYRVKRLSCPYDGQLDSE